MKKLIVLLNLLFCLSLSATEYIGTLQMASGYTLKNVRVCLDEQGNLTLYHVKFARMMPMRVDVVLPTVTLRQDVLLLKPIGLCFVAMPIGHNRSPIHAGLRFRLESRSGATATDGKLVGAGKMTKLVAEKTEFSFFEKSSEGDAGYCCSPRVGQPRKL